MARESLAAQIAEAFAADQAANRPAVAISDIPVSYDAITDRWLTAVLCRSHPDAEVVAHRLDAPDDGTSNRRRIFVEYNEAGRAAGLPGSVFCKATHTLSSRQILGHSGGVICETTFYNQARALIELEAPQALFAAYDPVSFNSIIMLKDLGPGVTFCTHRTPIDRNRAEDQVGLLARFHGRLFEAPELDTALSALPTWYERFGNLQRFNVEECCVAGFRAAEAVIPPRLFRREAEIWPATIETVRRHRELPRTLCHGDVHLKNWYITPDGRMGLSDWAVAHRGHWARDLAYTIATALTVEDRRAWERDLIALYLDRMAAAGVPRIDFDEAHRLYRQALFSALAFWTMTLRPSAQMPDMHPEETSLTFIERFACAMDDNDALGAL